VGAERRIKQLRELNKEMNSQRRQQEREYEMSRPQHSLNNDVGANMHHDVGEHQQNASTPSSQLHDLRPAVSSVSSDDNSYEGYAKSSEQNQRSHTPQEQQIHKNEIQEGQDETGEKDDFNYDDVEIQKDAANELVAMMVHVMLGFFMCLFFGALVVSIVIVGKYGFLTLVLICSLMLIALSLGFFISSLMDKDRMLKPVRRKIRRWHAVATAVVVKEIRDFQLDMNEHLMLTDGSAQDDDYDLMSEDGQMPKPLKKRRGPRSKVFGFLVKPFLKKKDGRRFKFGKKTKNTDDGVGNNDATATHEMV